METISTATTDRLHDGTTRPLVPDDCDGVTSLHDRLTAATIVSRYLTPHPDLSGRRLAVLVATDGHDHVAYVSEARGRLTGFARYDRLPGTTTAEALVLADPSGQSTGAESHLLGRLAGRARQEGLTALVLEVLPIDREFLDVVEASGLHARRHLHCGVVTITIDLGAEQAP